MLETKTSTSAPTAFAGMHQWLLMKVNGQFVATRVRVVREATAKEHDESIPMKNDVEL